MHPLLMLPAAILGFLFGRKLGERHATSTTGASPIAGVSLPQWEAFVAKMEVAGRDHVSPRGRMGMFQMDARRLADVGVMTKAWKQGSAEAQKHGGSETVGIWVGQWAPQLSKEAFLNSVPLQYAAFVRSMREAAPKVTRHVGKDVDGAKATLSGLLGVCHVAGERGVVGFIEDPISRKKFPGTTIAFGRTNQIF